MLPLLRGPGSPNWPLLVVGVAAMKGVGKELFCPGKGKGLESWKAGEGVRCGRGLGTSSWPA